MQRISILFLVVVAEQCRLDIELRTVVWRNLSLDLKAALNYIFRHLPAAEQAIKTW